MKYQNNLSPLKTIFSNSNLAIKIYLYICQRINILLVDNINFMSAII